MYDEGIRPSPDGAILLVTAGTGGIRTLNEDEQTSLPRVTMISPKPSPSVKSQGRISNQIYKQSYVERDQVKIMKLASHETRKRSVTMMVGQETAADVYSDQKLIEVDRSSKEEDLFLPIVTLRAESGCSNEFEEEILYGNDIQGT